MQPEADLNPLSFTAVKMRMKHTLSAQRQKWTTKKDFKLTFNMRKKKLQKFNLIVCLDPLRALLLGKKYTISFQLETNMH